MEAHSYNSFGSHLKNMFASAENQFLSFSRLRCSEKFFCSTALNQYSMFKNSHMFTYLLNDTHFMSDYNYCDSVLFIYLFKKSKD